MSVPDQTNVIAPKDAAVFLALVDGARTIRDIAARIDQPFSTVQARLIRLRRRGLVAWSDGRQGTLHATLPE